MSERGNGFKIAMNALNVGHQIGCSLLDAQRRVIPMQLLCKRKNPV
jgi:hypothetical protein